MRPAVKKKLIIAAATSSGLLAFLGYPAVKSVYPIKKKATTVNDYLDLPTPTADLTKNVMPPEGVGTSVDIPVDVSHWLLLSLLKSKSPSRRDRALNELASQRRWNDAECLEIAQALDKQDVVRVARTLDADIRLFLPPPSMEFIEKTLESDKIEKLVKAILKKVSENSDSNCSSCTNFYTNLSIRIRPDSNLMAMNDLNQVDKMMRIESRKRKKSAYNEDVIRLKAVLNNIICGEQQAISMVKSGMLMVLLYFQQKYKDDFQINGLLSQILANLSATNSTKDYIFINGWMRILFQYTRSEHLELSMPAFKALANLDEESTKIDGIYGNHVYLLSPVHRDHKPAEFDVVFVHGLVGSVFKSWRQGSVSLDDSGTKNKYSLAPPTTELLFGAQSDNSQQSDDNNKSLDSPNGNGNGIANSGEPQALLEQKSDISQPTVMDITRCWPKDWLPEDVPGLRVLAVDYPTALSNWRTDCDLNKDNLKERAAHVMRQLKAANLGDRPIIWVAHSMGGLLVKQILVNCDEHLRSQSVDKLSKSDSPTSVDKFKENLLKQTKGVVFYSVPHKGSNLDWIERKNLQKLLLLTTEVIELQKNSPQLMELHEKFLNLTNQDVQFLSYAEDSISSFGVNKVVQWKGVLVHQDSLRFEKGHNYTLNIDHAHTCKPHSKQAITYVKTLEFIRNLVQESQTTTTTESDEPLLPYITFVM